MNPLMIPIQIKAILIQLENAGYQAWLVGGCVRDGLMGLEPGDWDICTDALPEQVKALFPDCLDYGVRHGTVTVRHDGVFAEITTFRAEGHYTDHRRPDTVTFIKDLNEDLARRDFTVNAIAMNARGELRDPFGGEADLCAGILRAVGDPRARFREDALRMLRAVRFSAQLGFSLEAEILQAVSECAGLVSRLAAERVCSELEKTLLTDRPEQAELLCSLRLLEPWGILRHTESLRRLRALPKLRPARWMGYALTLPETEPLAALRLDKKTISACRAVRAMQAEAPGTALKWKQRISRYGAELSRLCALVLGPAELETVSSVLESGDCCCLEDLAVDGTDALAAGLRGSEIREALDAALRHVWAHPEDNTSEKLRPFLRKEAESRDR